jgi:quercetin dioxygenase-like cupin family protein
MSVKELIESGILELYCLGIASEEERAIVDSLADRDERVRAELSEIDHALASYGSRFRPSMEAIRQKIFARIEEPIHEPALLSADSSQHEWLSYLNQLGLKSPSDLEEIAIKELPQNGSHLTMVLWATPESIIPDEEHDDLDEHFLICEGSCEMNVDGIKTSYSRGDYFFIPPHHKHSGVVKSGNPMIIIVQRRAA